METSGWSDFINKPFTLKQAWTAAKNSKGSAVLRGAVRGGLSAASTVIGLVGSAGVGIAIETSNFGINGFGPGELAMTAAPALMGVAVAGTLLVKGFKKAAAITTSYSKTCFTLGAALAGALTFHGMASGYNKQIHTQTNNCTNSIVADMSQEDCLSGVFPAIDIKMHYRP